MRVFDTYYFNIAEKVSFAKTKTYLEKMLAETGFSYKNIAFMLYAFSDEPQKKALAKFPLLEKYSFFCREKGIYPRWGFTSCSEGWREGKIYADKTDEDVISALFAKIPHTVNLEGYLILDRINWFPDSGDTIDCDADYSYKFPVTNWLPFRSNRIEHYRNFGDGRKYNGVSVCIEVTDKDEPRNSRAVIEKLIPYLGEPRRFVRKCTFPSEETSRFKASETAERKRLAQLAESSLPASKPHKPWADPHVMPQPDPKLPHVADKFTLEKAFKGTGFTRKKGQPNWLSLYACVDERGFLYEAYVQKLTVTSDFRVWVEISGYNFKIATDMKDYYVTEDGESLVILKQFAEFCVRLRGEYSKTLAEIFGETPAWHYEQSL